MEVREILEKAQDTFTVKRVYGEPYESNGMTVIPAAAVRGGGGGGGGEDAEGQGGEGGGFGVAARPVGAYVLRGEDVQWEPAIDVTKIVIGGQIVAVMALLVLRSFFKARAKVRIKG